MTLHAELPVAPGPNATLNDWLAHCERIHPTTIDMGLDRVRQVADRLGLGPKLKATLVTVAGCSSPPVVDARPGGTEAATTRTV